MNTNQALSNNSTNITNKTGYYANSAHNNSFAKSKQKSRDPYDLFRLCKSRAKKPQTYNMEPIWQTVTKGTCYVHREGTKFSNRLIPISCLPASQSFPNNSRNVLEFLNACPGIDDKWVSLPAYANPDNPNFVGDFQCATTGTKSDDEKTFDMTSVRECGEENGIDVSSANLLATTQLAHPYKQVHAFIYSISNILPASKSLPTYPKEKDNSTNKIMSWILFDDPKQIVNRQRANVKSSGDSAGVLTVIMKVSDLKNLIQLCY